MSQPSRPPPPRVSEFYERKRRLAYVFAWLSMIFLLVEVFLGSLLEFTSQPRAAAADPGVCLLHKCLTRDFPEGSRLLLLDPAMKLRGASLALPDTATALLSEGRDLTVFYGSRASVMTDGKVSRSIDLGQKWDVMAASPDPGSGGGWIFGWTEGKIVARRRVDNAWAAEIEIAKSTPVDRVSASIPLVAWRERGKSQVRTAVFDGKTFVPRADFEIGAATHWDTVLVGDRVLLAYYHRDDRTFKYVTLRLECCPGCAAPLASRKIAFVDPLLRLGRRVTGLAAIATGDRLRFFVTRTTAVMVASTPLDTLQPEPDSRLAEIAVDPMWRNVAGAIMPTALFFCSFGLVFLGVTLLRERGRIAAEGNAPPTPERLCAGILPRAMAYVLDFIVLFPLCLAIASVMAVSVEDFEDPQYTTMMLIWTGIEIVYRFGMELGLGWTVGKRILGLRVTELDGSRLRFRGALIRNLFRIIDAQVPYGVIIGLAFMIRTRRRQRLGDVLGRTMVIQDLGGGKY